MRIRFISLFAIMSVFLILLQSCDLDQIEKEYSDFNDAEQAGLFEKDWIPSDLLFESMTEIYLRTNLDLNTCIFSAKLAENDIETLKSITRPTNFRYEEIGIDSPSNWIESVNQFDKHLFIPKDASDSVFIAIDESTGRIFGWRNN